MGNTNIWPVLIFKDGRAGIQFLTQAFGFEQAAAFYAEDDPDVLTHGELRWPGGGGVMLGSVTGGEPPFTGRPAGMASIYIQTGEPDALHDRAVSAGAVISRPLRDEEYGSRGFTATDPEGNLWSFGTYAGE
ncbi:MAG: VOC family protein [Actinomycetota bacterium]